MNRKLQAIQDFIALQSIQVPIWGFIFNLILAAVLSYCVGRLYAKYGNSLSSRSAFSKNFVLLAVTTTLVISIIKSSLALSLGLVGALSIVRFRAAIKDPEELIFLFINIAIGLGLGAGQRLITIVAVIFVAGLMVIQKYYEKEVKQHNLYLTISTENAKQFSLEQIVEVLKKHGSLVDFRRLDEQEESFEASFIIDFPDIQKLEAARSELRTLDPKLHIAFLESKNLS